jgi:hypothetical protein
MMDLREKWDNSPELRDGVHRLLVNWAWHYRGAVANLGYPNHQPFTTPPSRTAARPPEYLGHNEAERVERVLREASQEHPEDEPRRLQDLARSLRPSAYRVLIRLEYVLCSDMPAQVKAAKLSVSRRTYKRRLDDAQFWFWQRYREAA